MKRDRGDRSIEYAIRGAIRNGWVRRVRRGVYSLTVAGRRAVESGFGRKPRKRKAKR